MDVFTSLRVGADVRISAIVCIACCVVLGACVLAAGVVVLPLVLILGYLIAHGLSGLNLAFFTHMPKPVGETGGGMANAIVGTLTLIGLASLHAIPVGLVSGIYLSEYPKSRLATAVRFTADVLNGIPSIVIGIFAYALVVLPVKHFSALAGGIALGFMMIPIITRTTEELLNLVPPTLREGALALGATRSRAAFTVMLPAALPGIMTGGILAVSRAAGEVAPILFTGVAYYMASLPTRPTDQFMDLGYHVYVLATQSPNIEKTRPLLYATVLVLLFLTFALNFAAILIRARVRKQLRALH